MEKLLTHTSAITSKYQTVIPAGIRQATKLTMNNQLIWQVVKTGKQSVIVVTPKPTNWANYISGLGKGVWQDVNTDKYLKQLRAEWSK